jgi:hypothetical protein
MEEDEQCGIFNTTKAGTAHWQQVAATRAHAQTQSAQTVHHKLCRKGASGKGL